MTLLDWAVLVSALAFIVGYGAVKTRRQGDLSSFVLAGRRTPWPLVALSVMATQASAITFLTTPGQAYADGMRFVQFYFGLPLAMVVLCVTAVPAFHGMKVFTAYEYLEGRFDLKTRALAASLFLLQRGLATGLTIFAPALVLSVLLGWPIPVTTSLIGGLVVVYTATGGARAVTVTQLHQMTVILFGMGLAFVAVMRLLPDDLSFLDAVAAAGVTGRLNVVDLSFDWDNRYNLWSGLIGGAFLALSYFGTDQSQVGRYLTGSSVTQSRLGLLFNGMAKVPMQFGILLVGAMVWVVHLFVLPPVWFNPVEASRLANGPLAPELSRLEGEHRAAFEARREAVTRYLEARRTGDPTAEAAAREGVREASRAVAEARAGTSALVRAGVPGADGKDVNYVFLRFVLDTLPKGVVGLVLAAVFCAAMSSAAGELSALATTSVVDVYRRFVKAGEGDRHYVTVLRVATAFWGLVAIGFAQYANRLGTLVEAVNVLGSLFYGTVLGIFLVAFYLPRVGGTAVFRAALAGEALVIALFAFTKIAFLWLNVAGCLFVVALAAAGQALWRGAPALPVERPDPAAERG